MVFDKLKGISTNARFTLLSFWVIFGAHECRTRWRAIAQQMGLPYRAFSLAINELINNGVVTYYDAPEDRGRPLRVLLLSQQTSEQLAHWCDQNQLHYQLVRFLLTQHTNSRQQIRRNAQLNFTSKNCLLLVMLLMHANKHGVVRNLSTKRIQLLTGMKAQAIRCQLNKLESLGFIFKRIPGVKNATILSRRSRKVWLNLGHPLLVHGQNIHNVIIACLEVDVASRPNFKSVSDLRLHQYMLFNILNELQTRPTYLRHPKKELEEIHKVLEKSYAESNHEDKFELFSQASVKREKLSFASKPVVPLPLVSAYYDEVQDLVNVLPSSVFTVPRKNSLIAEALRRDPSLIFRHDNPDATHHVFSTMDLWVSEAITLLASETSEDAEPPAKTPTDDGAQPKKENDDEINTKIYERIETFTLQKLNTLGSGEHTEEEIREEHEHMKQVTERLVTRLTEATVSLAKTLLRILKEQNICTRQSVINYSSWHTATLNKRQKAHLVANEKLAGVIQIIKKSSQQRGCFTNTLVVNQVAERSGGSKYLRDVIVTEETLASLCDAHKQTLQRMLDANHATNKGIIISALNSDPAS